MHQQMQGTAVMGGRGPWMTSAFARLLVTNVKFYRCNLSTAFVVPSADASSNRIRCAKCRCVEKSPESAAFAVGRSSAPGNCYRSTR
jgi:hypothetical protein